MVSKKSQNINSNEIEIILTVLMQSQIKNN